jgi:uncharacterized Zn ribbon protein
MKVECTKCQSTYDDNSYFQCPKCQQEKDFELGLNASRNNKETRKRDSDANYRKATYN